MPTSRPNSRSPPQQSVIRWLPCAISSVCRPIWAPRAPFIICSRRKNMSLHDKIAAQLPDWRERTKKLAKDHADVVIDDVTVGQVFGGMRDIKSLVTDISYVDPAEGIRFRGMSIPEVLDALPEPDGVEMSYVGGLYYLLMTGEVPGKAEAEEVEAEWAKRAGVPAYV